MAQAVKRTKEERVTVTKQVPDGVTLTLSKLEAEVIRFIMYRRVTGDPKIPARAACISILQALDSAEVADVVFELRENALNRTGYLNF